MPDRLVRDEDGFQRLIWGEVLIPDLPNTYGDIHSEENVREFAYRFMSDNFGVNCDHDTPDVRGQDLHVVESFIAREGDPDFIPGAWVIGIHVVNDDLWHRIMDNDITGFSYEAYVDQIPVDIVVEDEPLRFGITEPDIADGHQHTFMVFLDDDGRVVAGGTSEDQGHSHEIRRTGATEASGDHAHLFNYTHQEVTV